MASVLDKTHIRVSSLTQRVVLARFGKSQTEALETRDATSEFWQALVSYAFDGKMPNKGSVCELTFGGEDEHFAVRIERVGEKVGVCDDR